MRKRLAEYHRMTAVLSRYYRELSESCGGVKAPAFIAEDGTQKIEQVPFDILEKLSAP